MRKFYQNVRFYYLLTFLLLGSGWAFGQNAWINEIHYDNASSDVNEAVEIVLENPSSYTLSDFTVTLYNGNGGASYDSQTLDNFTVGSSYGNFTVYYWKPSSLQNGNDGVALDYQGTLIQFLSYEGAFAGVGGPADGVTATDLPVSETSSTTVGESLQLSGSGSQYSDFTWQAPATATLGDQNNGQTIGGTDVTAPTVSSGLVTEANATELLLVMSENVSLTDETGFSITEDGSSVSISSVSGSGTDSLVFTVSSAFSSGTAIAVSYDDTQGDAQDDAGNVLATFADQAIFNAIPIVVSDLSALRTHATGDTFSE